MAEKTTEKKGPWYGSKTSFQSDLENGNEDYLSWCRSQDKIIEQNDAPANGPGHGTTGPKLPTSYAETLMHLFKGNLGSGLFAMGDAIKNAGIIFGPSVILILGLVCTHCQHLLLTAADTIAAKTGATVAPDYARTVWLCFENGPPSVRKFSNFMKKMVDCFLILTQLGFCCVYFVFISTNIKQVFDYYGFVLDVHLHMAIILIPIILSCWVRNLKYLAPISTIANILMAAGVVITIYFVTQDIPPVSERKYVASVNQIPLFFGTAVFAFEGIGLVLPLKNEMKKPELFQKPFGVLNVGMVFVTILYAFLGLMSYLKYGEDILGSVTLNIPEDDILAQSVKIIISTAIILTYALQFYIPVEIIWSSIVRSHGPMKHPVIYELCFRTGLVLVTFVLAEAIPYLNLFISFVGAMSSAALALLIPPVLELITARITPWIVMKNGFILIIGVIGAVTGTYESIVSIVHAVQEDLDEE